MKTAISLLALTLLLAASAMGADEIATLRHGTPVDAEATPAAMPKTINEDIREKRNYPMQPPLIPHDDRGYEVNLQVNKCMSCHARKRTEDSQAPMISVTHFTDRDGQVRAFMSARRYLCLQCHVTQVDAKPLVDNDFVDVSDLVGQVAAEGAASQ